MKKHSTAKPIPCFKRWSRTNYAVFASLHRQVTIGVLAVGMSILLLTTETAAAQQADTSGVSRVMRIEPVGVTIGETDGIYTEVTGPIKEGDRVVTSESLGIPAAEGDMNGQSNPFMPSPPGQKKK